MTAPMPGWVRGAGALGVLALALVLQLPSWSWVVEDAGISFSYARSLAEGWGPVPQVGGEVVEGYSNPLWVALLALGLWGGVDPFTLAPVLGLVGVWTAALAVGWRGRLAGREAEGGAMALLVAGSAVLAIWAQSGLENGLFAALLGLGALGLDPRASRWLAPLAFLGLALTRPEGVAYGAVGLLAGLALGRATWRDRAVAWGLGFLAPLAAYGAMHQATFGLPLPATYYAKLSRPDFDLFAWDARTWTYLQRYAQATGSAAVLPLAVLGLVGSEGRRGLGALGLSALWALGMGVLPHDAPAVLKVGTVVVVCGGAVAAAAPRRPWLAAVGVLGLVGLAFCVRSTGDWMKGYRWLSLVAVPWAVVLGAGLTEAHGVLSRVGAGVARGGVALLGTALLVPPWAFLVAYVASPEIHTEAVMRRATYYGEVADALGHWRRPVVVDHDMGGLLWEGGERLAIRDARGLVDLPFALHGRKPQVVDELLRDEGGELPFLVHLHASTRLALQRRPWFREGYVEIPGVPVGEGRHDGIFVAREALRGGPWEGRRRIARYEGFQVTGVRVRSREVAAGASALVELGLLRPADGVDEAEVVVFLVGADGAVAQQWTINPGQGRFPVAAWRADEELVQRQVLALAPDLAPGWYDLGVFVRSGGVELPVVRRRPSEAPFLSPNEVLHERQLQVVDRTTADAAAKADRDSSFELGGDGQCERAEAAWDDAIAHRPGTTAWRTSRIWKSHARLAWCWATRARDTAEALRQAVPDPALGEPDAALAEAVDQVRRARSWYPKEPAVDRAGAMVGALCWGRAQAALARGERAVAEDWFLRAVAANPSFARARVEGERLRAARLRLPSAGTF